MEFERVLAVRTNKTVYRDGDRAVKLFGEDFRESDILNEALNHARAEETGLPVPALLEVCKIEGRWAIVTRFIPGKTLARRMDEEPEKREAYLERFVALNAGNLRQALLASGSIPMVMEGVRDLPGAGAGTFRDGGLLDYHLDLPYSGDDIVLYPHFTDRVIP